MPYYYFNVHDGADQPDHEGIDLSGIDAVRSEALKLAGQMIRDAGMRGIPGDEWRIDITDITGATVFLIDFSIMELQPRRSDKSKDRLATYLN